MQTPKSRNGLSGAPQKSSPGSVSSEPPQKVSPRAVRQLKVVVGPRYFEHTASSLNLASKSPKERSPKVSKSPASEPKRQNRVLELESKVSQLENDLSQVKDQLYAIEASKKQAEEDAEVANQRVLALSLKLEESQTRFSEEQSQALKSDAEIAQLKQKLEAMAESDAKHSKNFEDAQSEVSRLEKALSEIELLVEETKGQLEQSKVSEAKNRAMLEEQAKKMIDELKAKEGYGDLASELVKYRAHVNYLEELVSELKAQIEAKEGTEVVESKEISSMKLEIQQLRYALAAAEIRYDEERDRSKEQLTKAFEEMEEIKSESHKREAELENWLQTSKDRIEELKSKLMDRENEVQGVYEENDALNKKSRSDLDNFRTLLKDKENELQKTVEENEALKLQIKELNITDEIDSIRVSEKEALMKVGHLMKEVDRSNRRAAKINDELKAARLTNSEMEAELRRIKVQSDQWRKAAEAAAAMISAPGNNGQQKQLVERTGSMDSHYNNSPRMKKNGSSSPYGYELDDDSANKGNANVLKRFWKKKQK